MGCAEFSNDDLEALKTIGLEKKVLTLLNTLETLHQKNQQLEDEKRAMQLELAKFKKQSPPPQFTQKKYTFSLEKERSKPQVRRKIAKKGILEIDDVKELPNTSTCTCGSIRFISLRTRKKIVQDIRLKRNVHTQYH